LARALVPLALVFILAACGGGTQRQATSTRVLHGPGYSFAVPAAWRRFTARHTVGARHGSADVSVQWFLLEKPYDEAKFTAASRELDGVVAKLATQAGRTVEERTTTTVAGQKIRAYRYGTTRIGFVLVDTREYQLLCRLGSGGSDPDGACETLFSSFSLS
jgi:hypothetical protein